VRTGKYQPAAKRKNIGISKACIRVYVYVIGRAMAVKATVSPKMVFALAQTAML